MDDRDELWKSLKRAVDRAGNNYDEATFKRVRPLFEQLRRVVDQDSTGLEAFFETVGEGLVLAQQSLDRRSLSYLAASGQLGFPTVFRIPKVKAELYFSASERTGRGFLASIITKEESETKTTHSVSFDVVAAPPPPNVAQRAVAQALSGLFVDDLLTRQRIEGAVAARVSFLESASPDSAEFKRMKKIKDKFSRVIILRGAQAWALLRVCKAGFDQNGDCNQPTEGQAQTPNVEILYIEGDLDGAPSFSFENAAWPPGSSQWPSRVHRLFSLMATFADQQEDYLGRIAEVEEGLG